MEETLTTIFIWAGGDIIQAESDELVAVSGDLRVGEVKVTGAGSLPCTNVLHAVGPVWDDGSKGMEELLTDFGLSLNPDVQNSYIFLLS